MRKIYPCSGKEGRCRLQWPSFLQGVPRAGIGQEQRGEKRR